MTATTALIVFTDLDGTLVDHETYAWDAARPALDALATIGAGVVLASSKTAAEIGPLRHAMQLDDWPAIVENGAGVLPAHVTEVHGVARYDALQDIVANAPAHLRRLFRGFATCTTSEVAAMTGLENAAAALAKRRLFSEPGQWLGDEAYKSAFMTYLAGCGVAAQQGGRFLTLSFGGNKAGQMRAIIAQYNPRQTVALGDAPNDTAMLELADIGIVVANPHRAPLLPLKGEDEGRIIRTTTPGPSGWNAAILTLLDRLAFDQGQTHG